MRKERLKRNNTAQKMKFSIKDFFSKCDKLRNFKLQLSKLTNSGIWSHILKKSLMEKFIFLQSNKNMRLNQIITQDEGEN